MIRALRRSGEQGNALIEFALAATVLVPLFVSMVVFGTGLRRMMQATQVARDAGHMYVRGVDFSLAGNQSLVVRLASGMGMTRTGGKGVVILSRVMKIGPQQCTDGGVSLPECTNLNEHVITQRIVIGNKSLKSSKIGTPTDTIINSDGSISPTDYLKNSTAVAGNFGAILELNPGEEAYVSEAWFESPLNSLRDQGPVYARSIF